MGKELEELDSHLPWERHRRIHPPQEAALDSAPRKTVPFLINVHFIYSALFFFSSRISPVIIFDVESLWKQIYLLYHSRLSSHTQFLSQCQQLQQISATSFKNC